MLEYMYSMLLGDLLPDNLSYSNSSLTSATVVIFSGEGWGWDASIGKGSACEEGGVGEWEEGEAEEEDEVEGKEVGMKGTGSSDLGLFFLGPGLDRGSGPCPSILLTPPLVRFFRMRDPDLLKLMQPLVVWLPRPVVILGRWVLAGVVGNVGAGGVTIGGGAEMGLCVGGGGGVACSRSGMQRSSICLLVNRLMVAESARPLTLSVSATLRRAASCS